MSIKKEALIITTVGGFLQQFEMQHVRLLQEAGYHIHYASNFNNRVYDCDIAALAELGIKIHHVNIQKNPAAFIENYKALRKIIGIIKKENIQIVHCHNPVGGVIGRLAGHLCGNKCLKVIYTAHGFHFYKGASWTNWLIFYQIEKMLARLTDVLIVINKEDCQYASSFKLKPEGKVYWIPGTGLDLTKFKMADDKEKKELRKELSISDNQFFLLSVGELNKNKNHTVIIKALSLLKKQGLRADQLHYGICGDGCFKQELTRQIQKEELEDYISLYGYTSDVRKYLAAADSFAFPTIREGFGMACIEAMAMGLPIIALDNRGIREYMRHNETGIICRSNSAEEFARSIELMMTVDAETYRSMVKNCRRTAENYDINTTIYIMKHMYEEVISKIEKCREKEERDCYRNNISCN